MKFKITRQVPGVLRYEFAALEVEGDMQVGTVSTTEFFDAVNASDRWASEQRGKLSERVLASLSQDGQPQTFTPSHAPAQTQTARQPSVPPTASQARPAASHAQPPQGGGQKASEVRYGPLGYPVAEYQALIGRLVNSVHRNGSTAPAVADQNGPKQVERDFVRAAAWSKHEKTGKEYCTIKNTMQEYAADLIGRFPSWGPESVSKAWDRLVDLEKALLADGHVELSVSMWKDGAIQYAQVSYSIPQQQGTSGADEGMGDDESLPF